eukprot:6858281-Pyramimonas_sp.AAC.1
MYTPHFWRHSPPAATDTSVLLRVCLMHTLPVRRPLLKPGAGPRAVQGPCRTWPRAVPSYVRPRSVKNVTFSLRLQILLAAIVCLVCVDGCRNPALFLSSAWQTTVFGRQITTSTNEVVVAVIRHFLRHCHA